MTDRGKGDRQPDQTGLFEGSAFAATQPLHMGHRDRLRDRFRKGGAEALPDFELLELILSFAPSPAGTQRISPSG